MGYKPEDLKKLQKVQTEILGDVHKVCEANNIQYQIFAGTLLGAVRHNGFIPWDDDIDISMLRKDYEKFLKVAQKSLGDKYFVQNYKTDPEFVHHFTRIRKNNSLMLQKAFKDQKIHHGIFIDVFPLDDLPNSKKVRKKYIKKLRFHQEIRASHLVTSRIEIKSFKDLIKAFKYGLVRLVPKNFWDKLAENTRKKYEGEMLSVGEFSLSLNEDEIEKTINKKKYHQNSRLYTFEGIQVYGPEDFDYVLKKLYGDYWELPSEKDRAAHHGVIELKVKTIEKFGK